MSEQVQLTFATVVPPDQSSYHSMSGAGQSPTLAWEHAAGQL